MSSTGVQCAQQRQVEQKGKKKTAQEKKLQGGAPTGCTSKSMPLAASASLTGSARPLQVKRRAGGHDQCSGQRTAARWPAAHGSSVSMGVVCGCRSPDGEVEDGGLAHVGWVNCAGGQKVESGSMLQLRQLERRRRQPPSGAMESRSGIAM